MNTPNNGRYRARPQVFTFGAGTLEVHGDKLHGLTLVARGADCALTFSLSSDQAAHDGLAKALVPFGMSLIEPGYACDVIQRWHDGGATWDDVERELNY